MSSVNVIDVETEPEVRFEFSHTTTYRYSGPVKFGIHRLVLRPREGHHQHLEHMQLTTSPVGKITWSEDIFGNMMATVELDETASELVITSEFTVLRTPYQRDSDPEQTASLVDLPLYYRGYEQAATGLYCQSVYPTEVEGIRSWIRSTPAFQSGNGESLSLEGLAEAIKEQITYRRREVPGVQSPLETLQLGTGSCRDTAVLMMEGARSVGLAARFVSGYLESENSKVGVGSTHAWTQVYLPDRGWVGYDPSIGKPVALGHIAVAVSHHPRGVMPISGTFQGQGNVSRGMNVAISSKRLADGA